MSRIRLAGAAAVVLLHSATASAQHVIREISAAELRGTAVQPRGLNDLGQVVGFYHAAGGQDRAFIWGGIMRDLHPDFDGLSRAFAINDDGLVVGEAEDLDGDVTAFRWPGSGPLILQTIYRGQHVNGFESTARDVNDAGVMVGWAYASTSFGLMRRAYRWSGGVVTPLGTLGGFNSFAYGLSAGGLISGQSSGQFPNQIDQAFLWIAETGMHQLETATSQGLDVNDEVHIVGWQLGGGHTRATEWHEGPMGTYEEQLLGTLPGDTDSIARSINADNTIVGVSFGGPDGPRAVRWDKGTIVNLNTVIVPNTGWVLTDAFAINDQGHVTGVGTLNGQPGAYLMSNLAVDVIDPVPALLSGPAVSTNAELLGAATGPVVSGLTADGVTQVLLRIVGMPGPGDVTITLHDEKGSPSTVGTLRTPGHQEDLTTLTVPAVPLQDGRHMAFVLLVAPENFIRGSVDRPKDRRPIEMQVTYVPDNQGSLQVMFRDVDLWRPPVLFMHGLWSEAATWEWDPNRQPAEDEPLPFVFYRHDYQQSAGDSLLHNALEARTGVAATLALMRDGHVAATQADVVAHSMGGLLTRMYVAGDFQPGVPQAAFHRNDNFMQGDVNRLITLATPHKGSPVANVLMAMAESPNIVAQSAVGLVGDHVGCVICGAIHDLQTTSSLITSLKAANVPAHAVIGTGGAAYIQQINAEAARFALSLKVPLFFQIPPDSIFGAGVDHDLLVPRPSAEGGLPTGSAQVTVVPLIANVTNGTHGDLPDDNYVRDIVIDLLNTPVTDANVYAPGFPAAPGGGPPFGGFQLPSYGNLVTGLVITSPASGTVVHPGDVVTVTVGTLAGFTPQSVMVLSQLDLAIDDAPPYSVNLHVPLDANGTMTLTATGLDAELDAAVSADVVLQVEVTAALTGLEFVQDRVFLYSFGHEAQLGLTGHYADGVDRDLTDPALGTSYVSLDPRIAAVSAAGRVSAVAVGTATIQASNGGHSATMDVVVESITCTGDVDRDGAVGITDLLQVLASWGGCKGAGGCAADIDGDGTVGITDLLAMLSAWGPCGN